MAGRPASVGLQGFFAEFIPVVGTYIGAAAPTVVTLGIQEISQAVVLLAWTVVYQQIDSYWLSPRISAQKMEINGGVAFGSALAGGAIAGPMGAFMAMPIAALATSFVKHYVPRYELVQPASAAAHAANPGPAAASDPDPTDLEADQGHLDDARVTWCVASVRATPRRVRRRDRPCRSVR